MPQISAFLGVVIRMHYQDHDPPHFHAVYSGFEGIIDIQRNVLIAGDLPVRVFNLVTEWASLHRAELMDNWNRAREKQPLLGIAPLV